MECEKLDRSVGTNSVLVGGCWRICKRKAGGMGRTHRVQVLRYRHARQPTHTGINKMKRKIVFSAMTLRAIWFFTVFYCSIIGKQFLHQVCTYSEQEEGVALWWTDGESWHYGTPTWLLKIKDLFSWHFFLVRSPMSSQNGCSNLLVLLPCSWSNYSFLWHLMYNYV